MKNFEERLIKRNPNNSNDDYRTLKSISAGNYKLSIQGSYGHYCSPRETLRIGSYNSMEIAIFNKKGWFKITKSSVLKKFPRYSELCERADGLESPYCVFGYVPVDLIEDLYLYLNP